MNVFNTVFIRKPIELGIGDCDISILEMREGNEPGELWNVIGSKDRSQYYSLLKGETALENLNRS